MPLNIIFSHLIYDPLSFSPPGNPGVQGIAGEKGDHVKNINLILF